MMEPCKLLVLCVEQAKGQKVAYFMDRGQLVHCWRRDASGDEDWCTA